MSSAQSRKRKSKGFYLKAAKGGKKAKLSQLASGMKGFLITCNKREKESVREAYNLFNEYADAMYGPEQKQVKVAESGSEEEDIDKALAAEISALKKDNEKDGKDQCVRRFQVVDSGATNCVFIKTTLDQPEEMLHKIFSDISQSQKSRSRFMLRVTPVVGSCRADAEKIDDLCMSLFPRYFPKDSEETYAIVFKVRNNATVGRNMIFNVMGEAMRDVAPFVKVNLKNPDVVINVDVLKTVCCVGFLRDFFKFKKYNIQEIVKPTATENIADSENSTKPENADEISADCGEMQAVDPSGSDDSSKAAPADLCDERTAVSSSCDKSDYCGE